MKTPTYHRFSFVNSFNSSQLKLRIKMMNQPQKRWAFVKYPLALLMAASLTMAFVSKERIVKNLPKLSTIQVAPPVPITETKSKPKKSNKTKTVKNIENQEVTILSRYVVVADSIIYVAITAQMSFEDLAQTKQIIEQKVADTRFEINTLKFDPFHNFITQVDAQLSRINGGSAQNEDIRDDYTPIQGMFLYRGFGQIKTHGTGHFDASEFSQKVPKILSDVANEDLTITSNKQIAHSKEYAALKIEKDFKNKYELWGRRNYSKTSIEKQLKRQPNSGGIIYLQPGDFLQLNSKQPDIYESAYFLDGKPIYDNELSKIKTSDIYQVIVFEGTTPKNEAEKQKQYVLIFSDTQK